MDEYIGQKSEWYNIPQKELLKEAYGNLQDFYKYGGWFSVHYYETNPYDNGCFAYRFVYRFSKQQNDAFEEKLSKVLRSLKLNGLSDKAKAVKIYKWITRNIKYDRELLKQVKARGYAKPSKLNVNTAYNALINKKSVCQGIACLYSRMLKNAGVDAECISGNLRGWAHNWVLVKIGNYWYNADPTSDLGKSSFQFLFKTEKYFQKNHRVRSKEYKKADL